MLKKTINYTDYNGEERSETFYFNLTAAEITEMELSVEGGLKARFERIIETKDTPSLIKEFKQLILLAYGQKSEDGRRFIKSEKLKEEFAQTAAYSELFMELATDSKAAANFVNSIIPKNVAEQVKKENPELLSQIEND